MTADIDDYYKAAKKIDPEKAMSFYGPYIADKMPRSKALYGLKLIVKYSGGTDCDNISRL